MKAITIYTVIGILPLLVSCTSERMTLSPVGPRPVAWEKVLPPAGKGQLEVFTETDEYEWGQDVPFFPHRDYQICTPEGKRVERVWNHQTHEDETPATVTLPAGRYLVKADAEFYGPVTVPVVIRPDQTTRVVLQPGWKPAGEFAASDLVGFPSGYFVGWRADRSGQK